MLEIVTQAEAARIVGMTDGGIHRWIVAGLLPATKMGRIVMIKLSDLKEVNEQQLQKPGRQRYIKAMAS